MTDWTKVKEFTPILIETSPFSEPISAKFKSFSETENRIYYYKYGFVGIKHLWGIKEVKWTRPCKCTTNKVLSFNLSN